MKNLKKLLSLFLALVLCLGMVNLSVLAVENECPNNQGYSHEYVDGKCKYCGKDDPNTKPEECEHKNTYEKVTNGNQPCTDQGHWQLICKDCNKVVDEHDCPPSDHMYINGVCKYCGKEEPKPEEHKHMLEYCEGTPATCESLGMKASWYCTGCAMNFWDKDGKEPATKEALTIPVLEADFGAWTDNGNGTHTHVCTNCKGAVKGHSETETHSWNDGVPSPEDGVIYYTCKDCGAQKKEDIPVKEHTLTFCQGKPATCTEEGRKDYWYCADSTCCGKKYFDSEGTKEVTDENDLIIPAGHVCPDQLTWDESHHWSECKVCGAVIGEKKTHEWKEVYNKPATCTETGEIKYDCAVLGCNASMVKEIPATGHDWSDWQPDVVKPENTSVQHFHFCQNDNCDGKDGNGKTAVEYEGHNFTGWHIVDGKAPTCTEAGTKVRECTDCGWKEEQTVEPLGHNWGEWNTIKNPTCTEPGEAKHECQRDGCNASEDMVIPATGHDWSDWQPDVVKPENTSVQHFHFCQNDNCDGKDGNGKTAVEYEGHNFGDWVIVKEATTTEEGLEKRVCSDCHYEDTRPIQKLENQGPGNQSGSTTTRYTLTINYVYANGTQARTPHIEKVARNASYSVESPSIEGYTADITLVTGTMTGNLTVTVTYTPVVDIEGEDQPPLTEDPEDKDPIDSDPSGDAQPDDPTTDIPDGDVPTTDIPDGDVPTTDIPDGDVPTTDIPDGYVPTTDIPDENPPLVNEPELTDIPDEDVPMVGVPQTGDISLAWYGAAILSLCGLAVLTLKKREGEEG